MRRRPFSLSSLGGGEGRGEVGTSGSHCTQKRGRAATGRDLVCPEFALGAPQAAMPARVQMRRHSASLTGLTESRD